MQHKRSRSCSLRETGPAISDDAVTSRNAGNGSVAGSSVIETVAWPRRGPAAEPPASIDFSFGSASAQRRDAFDRFFVGNIRLRPALGRRK